MIRCVPGEDHTNGFFVSCFVKKGSLPDMGNQKRKYTSANSGNMTDDEDEEGEDLDEGEDAATDVKSSGATALSNKKKKKKNKRKKKKGAAGTIPKE